MMQMTLSESDLIVAVREYLERKGLRATTAVVNGAWTKGATCVVCDVVDMDRNILRLRPYTESLPGAAEEGGARALYDLVLRVFAPGYPFVPWEEMPVDTKKQWLKEADRVTTARVGRGAT